MSQTVMSDDEYVKFMGYLFNKKKTPADEQAKAFVDDLRALVGNRGTREQLLRVVNMMKDHPGASRAWAQAAEAEMRQR